MVELVLALLLAPPNISVDPSQTPCPAGYYLTGVMKGRPPFCAQVQGGQVQGQVSSAATATTAGTATYATTSGTAGNATTAGSAGISARAVALDVAPTACSAGQAPTGVDSEGDSVSCTAYSQPGHGHVATTDLSATGTKDSTTFLRGDDTWAVPPAGGGGAPATAQYWTGAADGTLSAEKNLGALSTGLVINTAGVPSAYAGGTCTAPNFVRVISASGAVTCAAPTLSLSSVSNPTGDWTATFPTGSKALWTFTGSTDEAFTIHGDGAFTGTGDLVHINKTGTGAAAGADALHVEVTTDTNMTGLRVTMANSTRDAINTNALVTAAGFSGPLTGNASTATALAADGANCSAGQAPLGVDASGAVQGCFTPAGTYTLPDAAAGVKGGLELDTDLGGTAAAPQVVATHLAAALPQAQGGTGAGALTCTGTQKLTSNGTTYSCAADQDTVYTLPAASTTLGGVKMAASCSAGNHVASIGVGGELGCTADAGGTGAPTGAQYWVGAADAGLSAEKDLSGFTGLVLNTAGTPSSKGTNTCTNQFPRSDNASGVWTCATIAAADLPAASTTLGAVKHAANCSAGNHVNGIGAGGELSCSADSGGAPTFSGLTAGGVMYANSTTTIVSTGTGTSGRSGLMSGGTGAPTWVQEAWAVTMTQDRSPSGTITTGQTTTDLTWGINANEGQTFTCNLTSTSTAASKLRYAVAGPASMTYVNCRTITTTTALTTAVAGMLQGQWASTCTNCTPSVTASVLTSKLTDTLHCTVVNGSTGGSITIYFAASTAANTNTLHKGSGCVITGGG